jgi:hypothetical protein
VDFALSCEIASCPFAFSLELAAKGRVAHYDFVATPTIRDLMASDL